MKKILIVSDLHWGSVFSPWNPDFKLKSGNAVTPNPAQQQLNEYFDIMVGEVNKKQIDVGVLLGDAIDGSQRRNIGRWLVSADLDDQKGAVIEALKRFKVPFWYGVTGTEYHELATSDVHFDILKELNGGDTSGWKDTGFNMNVGVYTLDFAHGSSSSFIYPEMVMGREKLFMLSQAEINKCGYADAIFRGHLHFYNEGKAAGARVVKFPDLDSPAVTSLKTCICPGFQAQTVYMKKKSPYKLIPDIGYVLVEIDEYGVHIKERLFEPVRVKIERVTLPLKK